MAQKKRRLRQLQSSEKAVVKPGNDTPGFKPEAAFARLFRQDMVVAVLLAACFLILYARTLCPTIYVQDSGEFSTIAATWGVGHPPGYPLYTLLCGLFVRLLPAGGIAWRSNLFSALCASFALGMLFLLCRRIGASRPAACAAALCMATGQTFWSQAITAEVYSFDILLILITLLAALRLFEKPSPCGYFLCGLAGGFMVGHRVVNLLFIAPTVLVFMDIARRRGNLPLSVLLLPVWAGLASGLVYLYLPIASAYNPPIDMGDPETLGRFWDVISARPYRRHFGTATLMVELSRAASFFWTLPATLGIAALAAPFGFRLLLKRFGWLVPAGLLFAALFCIGFSAMYNIMDIAAYFIPATAIVAIFAAAGFDCLPGRLIWLAVILGLAGLPLHFRSNDLSTVRIAEQFGRDVYATAPPGAIILVAGDTSTNALLYLQGVEGLRPDVVIVNPEVKTDWYAQQLRRTYPQVIWPERDPESFPAAAPGKPADTWLKALVSSNIGKREICLLEPPSLKLRGLGLAEFQPGWGGIPDGLLYCIESPQQPFKPQERLAGTAAFWEKQPASGWPLPDGADIELPATVLYYIVARFAFAAALVNAGQLDAAMEHLRAIVAQDPDQIEEKVNQAYVQTGVASKPFLFGARARKALAAPPGDRAAVMAALSGR